MKTRLSVISIFCSILTAISSYGQIRIIDSPKDQVIKFENSHIGFTLNYHNRCEITKLVVNGEPVITSAGGMVSEIRTAADTFSTGRLTASPLVETGTGRVALKNIRYGDEGSAVFETWTFRLSETDIIWEIDRTVPSAFVAEETAFPAVRFSNIGTWEGANTGYGGLAWFYLFNEKLCTYGVHSGEAAFWNDKTGNGLKIKASAAGQQTASKFCRSASDELVWSVSLSEKEMVYRYDSDTKRRRFIRKKTDVWAPVTVPAGTTTESVTFSWLNYREESNRGNLVGINGGQVSRLLNTIARIGVIDARLFGGNSWHTPYGPVCLHEQYIGQMGIAINDPQYIEGYKECLDYYRDHAIRPDGRVISRWAYDNSDAMAGTATPEGFYEAQWGYLFDSNPDFVINVADLYNQCGDLDWVRNQKAACEAALEYLLQRDSDGDQLVEMMTNDHSERKGSDWIDIIWASYENAFINAELYQALNLWSDIEQQLGDIKSAERYTAFAGNLKKSFNKSTREGGFWDEKNQWFVHWLDKDGSVHGNNLVVPVNFMAIAYGLCDQDSKKAAILDRIESQMQKENLFAWPICLYTYEPGEGLEYQYPFPNYENGDIFLSWGAMGVEAYAGYKPDLALKYIQNILTRYEQDGLAFQHYGRLRQDGLGDDILAGNSLAIVGLYKSIYGINPMYNRLLLNPHLPGKMDGTELNYTFRGERLKIKLEKTARSVRGYRLEVKAAREFGVRFDRGVLEYFEGSANTACLVADPKSDGTLSLEIIGCEPDELHWIQNSTGKRGTVTYIVSNLIPNQSYTLYLDGRARKTLLASPEGYLQLKVKTNRQFRPLSLKIVKREA
ncbi:MAG: hypothetical protein WC699_02745 [Bacteroidales bacterium]|jgi:hypothetical protein